MANFTQKMGMALATQLFYQMYRDFYQHFAENFNSKLKGPGL